MNIREIQKKLHFYPALDIEVLLGAAIQKPKEFLYTHPEYQLTLAQRIHLRYSIFLYKKDYSVAAIIGHKEFYGLQFLVNKHVLIPRPDTELMVEEAIQTLGHELETKNTNIIYIDVGTGSGCIPISIIKNLPKLKQVYAIDNSSKALTVAKKNAQKHQVHIDFLHGNLLEPILKHRSLLGTPCFFTITANLPYLSEAQFKSEPSIQREPKNALVAKNNGLFLYEKLLSQIKDLPNFCQMFLFLEIDPSQTEAITQLVFRYIPKAQMKIRKDLGGLDRLVLISL